MSKLLLHAWSVKGYKDNYYLPYTHYIYLKEIARLYDEVVLLSPCQAVVTPEFVGEGLNALENVSVYELPYSPNYIGAIKNFFHYVIAYRKVKNVTTYYSRFPTPFGWLQKAFCTKKSRRIVHYVGDPVDAANNNPNFSRLKKRLLILGFGVEDFLYRWACKGAELYTNGTHLSFKLSRYGLVAKSLVSTTLTDTDFCFEKKHVDTKNISFVYVGYLRTAKGVETVIDAFAIFQKEYPGCSLKIVGDGELEAKLKNDVASRNIESVFFLGNIQDRERLNQVLRSSDVFLFGSNSEGSPRVILEAMANGLPVVSTPVGSLPATFDSSEIVFARFNDPNDFVLGMRKLILDDEFYQSIRFKAFGRVKNMTVGGFIRDIFDEN